MARDRTPSLRMLLCMVMLAAFALTGCASPVKPVHIGPTVNYYESSTDDATATCSFGVEVGGRGVSLQRCDVYVTRSTSRAIAGLVHDHPVAADAVQQALSMIGEVVCTVITKLKIVGLLCGAGLNIGVDLVRDVLERAYNDRSCLLVGFSGVVMVEVSLDTSVDPKLCRD